MSRSVPKKRYGGTRSRFLSGPEGAVFELCERGSAVPADGLIVLIPPLEQDHGGKCLAMCLGNALEALLVMPNDVAKNTLDTVASRGVASGASNGHADLERPFNEISVNKAVQDADTAAGDSTALGVVPIEKRINQPSPFQPARGRKAYVVGGQLHTDDTRVDPYLPLFVSLTVRFFLPLARRRASTRRPFLVAMRERNPCLLARLRRLG